MTCKLEYRKDKLEATDRSGRSFVVTSRIEVLEGFVGDSKRTSRRERRAASRSSNEEALLAVEAQSARFYDDAGLGVVGFYFATLAILAVLAG